MRKILSASFAAMAALVLVGCTGPGMHGPERKFGRGINNMTELVRGGEMRRSLEQTALFRGPDVAYTTGFVHGLNRSLARTFVGVYEVVTFPIPNGPGKDYSPIITPENPVYPASYKPGLIADQTFATDANLGFSGGDVAPFIPGSRFRVFDN